MIRLKHLQGQHDQKDHGRRKAGKRSIGSAPLDVISSSVKDKVSRLKTELALLLERQKIATYPDDYKKEIESLEWRIESYSDFDERLERDFNELQKSNLAVEEERARIKPVYDKLVSEMEEIRAKYDELPKIITTRESEIQSLDLKARYSDLYNEYDDLMLPLDTLYRRRSHISQGITMMISDSLRSNKLIRDIKENSRIWMTDETPISEYDTDRLSIMLKDKVSRMYDETGATQEEVDAFVHQWATTSNKGISALIQKIASEELSVSVSPWQSRIYSDYVDEKVESKPYQLMTSGLPPYTPVDFRTEKMRPIIREMYKRTQESLKDYPLTDDGYIILFRGMVTDKFNPNTSGITKIKLNALESWTTDFDLARDWKGGGDVFMIKVKPDRIFSTPRTGFGCLEESEFVVLGTPEGEYDEAMALFGESKYNGRTFVEYL